MAAATSATAAVARGDCGQPCRTPSDERDQEQRLEVEDVALLDLPSEGARRERCDLDKSQTAAESATTANTRSLRGETAEA